MPSTHAPRGVLPPSLAFALLEAREARGWSLRHVARRLGLSAPYLSRLEHGTRAPSRTVALALIALYDLETWSPGDARQLFALAAADAGRDHPAYRRAARPLPMREPGPMGNTP